MKVIELISENFKRLNAHVVMNGKSVTVSGKNGVGKSSFIDAVWIALTGKDVPAQPIEAGKDTAKISVTVKADDGNSFIVERKFTQSGGMLTVKTLDGAKFPTPQKFLDERIGRISFDPFEFINKPPREQKKFLIVAPKEDARPAIEATTTQSDQQELPEADYEAPAADYGELQPELLIEITEAKTLGQLEIRYRKMTKENSDPAVLEQLKQAYELKKKSFG